MITNDPGVEEVRILFVANLPSVTEMLMNENVPGVNEVRIFFLAYLPSVAKIRMITNDPGVDEVRILVVANLPALAKLLMIENVPEDNEVRIRDFFDYQQLATEGRMVTTRMRTSSAPGSFFSITRISATEGRKVGDGEDVHLVHNRAILDHPNRTSKQESSSIFTNQRREFD
ncbi:hypothetical protein pipiens_012818 [Culex pipiens pipiens]|uniref:Uncharacterized protein n=1 Tax=Culex pipiens pipiens TaxID=38569 RepID=A0ABD1D0V8_CULPP